MNKREVGSRYEHSAAEFLAGQGYKILDMNFRNKAGEIDIIGESDGYLCFIEVKYRSGSGYGFPSEAVDTRKRRRIVRTALGYLNYHKLSLETPCRFDTVLILDNEYTLIKNAFEGIL
ncbi:MAG: YraN family protein [Clostridiales bacterium]|mgnify:CR=1 FL=1|nr:YraN family protein [Clostridiales bacterium]